jgi:hypothetical protein
MASHIMHARRSNQRRITEDQRKKATMKENHSMKNFFRSFIVSDCAALAESLSRRTTM